jgi:hypothetical protein
MANAVVTCFVEDFATESFVGPLIQRLAGEEPLPVSVRFVSARGGAGTAKTHFRSFQRAHAEYLLPNGRPDLLVLVLDCDCRQIGACRSELEALVDNSVFAEHVIGAPESHVEAWYLADPITFGTVVGGMPPPPPARCEKDAHKKRLREAVAAAGHPITNDGAEFGPDLVWAMDFIRAATADATLGAFVQDVRLALRRVALATGT